MVLKRYFIIALVAITVILLYVGGPITVTQESSSESSPGLHTGWMMELGGGNITYNRTFEYYIPTSYTGFEEVPLLFSFHGLGSTGDEQRDLTKFDALAEDIIDEQQALREDFINIADDLISRMDRLEIRLEDTRQLFYYYRYYSPGGYYQRNHNNE